MKQETERRGLFELDASFLPKHIMFFLALILTHTHFEYVNFSLPSSLPVASLRPDSLCLLGCGGLGKRCVISEERNLFIWPLEVELRVQPRYLSVGAGSI